MSVCMVTPAAAAARRSRAVSVPASVTGRHQPAWSVRSAAGRCPGSATAGGASRSMADQYARSSASRAGSRGAGGASAPVVAAGRAAAGSTTAEYPAAISSSTR
jgi:hypothetical protein